MLGETGLSTAQVTALTDFVNAGGSLIALRPDAKLAPLLGLTKGTGTPRQRLPRGQPAVEAGGRHHHARRCSSTARADRYTLSGATSVANLYTSATASTDRAGGVAADGRRERRPGGGVHVRPRALGRATRARATRRGRASRATASSRSARTSSSGGVNVADWVNLAKVSIPQADEQQRLLANLIETMDRHRMPLPRFWYFPRSLKAVVVGTGDDHAGGGTAGRFDQYLANSPAGCSVADWTCPRFTSYIFTATPLTNAAAAAYDGQGFEIALHPDTDCDDFTPGEPREHVLDAARRSGAPSTARCPARRPTGRTAWSGATGHGSRRRSWRTAMRLDVDLLLLAERVDPQPAGLHDRLGHPDAVRRHDGRGDRRLPGADADDRRVGPELPDDDQHAARQRARRAGLLRRVHDELPHGRRHDRRERRS